MEPSATIAAAVVSASATTAAAAVSAAAPTTCEDARRERDENQ